MKRYDNLIMISNSRSGHNFVKNNILSWLGVFKDSDLFKTKFEYEHMRYFNLEQTTPYMLDQKMKKKGVKINEINLMVTLLRDYLNWLASYTLLCRDMMNRKRPQASFAELSTSIKIWTILAKKMYENPDKGMFYVNYDFFRTDRGYREKLCERIDGKYNEDFLNKMSKQGYFSSFDGHTYANNASEMKLDERYLQILDTQDKDVYLKILKRNEEALRVYLKYFKVNEEKKRFIRDAVGEVSMKKSCCS